MKRLIGLMYLTCGLWCGAFLAQAQGPPNIVLVLVDDLGWSDVAYQGSEVYETPSVDRLAAQGMVFTDFYSGGPVCSPTRASILTGKSTARTGITTYLLHPGRDAPYVTDHLPLEEVTIAETLRKHGYATGYFGKWHLGYRDDHWATRQGFDVALGGMDLPWAWKLCWPDREAPMMDRGKGHQRFFSPHHLTHMADGPEGEYLTERLTNETMNFIEENRAGPFFAFLSYHTVHTPLQAKPELVARYEAKIEALGLSGKREPDPKEKRFQNLANYAAMVHHMDENVGRLMGKLKELGLTDNTIVVWTSDNGGKGSVTSNLPLRGMKHNLYEGGIRIPTVIRWPGRIAGGSRSGEPLITDDLYPTLLALAGLPPMPDQHVDGVSFKKLLLGEQEWTRGAPLCWHYPHNRMEAAIRDGDYKLLHRFAKNQVELYNLREDIGEITNLAEKEPERAEEMLAALTSWQKRVGARFPETHNR